VLALALFARHGDRYTALGIAAGLAGEGLAGALQQPAVLAVFSASRCAALSMFGFYDLQLPSAGQARLARPRAQERGRLGGVFCDGGDHAPYCRALCRCTVGRDLALHLANARRRDRGAHCSRWRRHERAAASGRYQRRLAAARAGRWMESVGRLFGVLLIAVALWLVSPVIPAWLRCWAGPRCLLSVRPYLRVMDGLPADATAGSALESVGLVLLVLGATQIVGAASGGRDVLRRYKRCMGRDVIKAESLAWRPVQDIDQLDAALADANGKPFCSTSPQTGASHARR